MSAQVDKNDDLPARVADRFAELLEANDDVPSHLPAAMRALLAESGVTAENVLEALTEVDGDPAP